MAESQLSTIVSVAPKPGNVTRLAPVANDDERQDVPAGGKVPPQQSEAPASREAVMAAVSDIADYVQSISRELQFQVDDNVGSTVITVVDRETGDVIRQIPSEEAVQMARFIAENGPDPMTGLLINSDGLK
ncbi:MAG: flagellar protein FlaG [Halioglobus sp.]|nr:flagellar protein FlaG [Halioglobus sp.]